VGRKNSKRPAAFIDRDGTLIRERNYLSKIKDIKLIGGVVKALKLLRAAGFRIVMITNQSGIGRGYFTEKKLKSIHLALKKMLKKKGAALDAIYYCPHLPDHGCECRKPRTGLVKKAAKKLNIDLSASYSIGDHTGDFLLGQNMGGKGIFVLTGHGKREFKKIKASGGKLKPDFVAKNLPAASKWILRVSQKAF